MYKVVAGDTWAKIARKVYGKELEAAKLAKANPGVSEPLIAGTVINTPSAPRAVSSPAPANGPDEVSILIDGERFRFWSTVRIIRALDTMDIVEFTAPFDPELQRIFRPFSFLPISISVGGSLLFTGTMVAVNPSLSGESRVISVSAYSNPGVLQDCTVPSSEDQREYSGQNLRQIATAICTPFGIPIQFDVSDDTVFEEVSFTATTRVFDFLAQLAQQRNLIMTNTDDGSLRFFRAKDGGNPVVVLQEGIPPLEKVTPFFSPQEYYSHITGIEPVFVGLEGSQFTVRNPFLSGILRPYIFNADDSETTTISEATKAKAGRMFGNMVSYEVVLPTWRDPSGALWSPDTIVSLKAPGAMVYNQYKFLIRSVELERVIDTEIATLSLVIPGSFNGKIPDSLPWDL